MQPGRQLGLDLKVQARVKLRRVKSDYLQPGRQLGLGWKVEVTRLKVRRSEDRHSCILTRAMYVVFNLGENKDGDLELIELYNAFPVKKTFCKKVDALLASRSK